MRLSIVGCPDKKKFRPFVKRAAEFYAQELISKKMRENLFKRIKFEYGLDVLGYAQIDEYNDSGKPREFLIEINAGLSAADILKCIAHEMVHVKQYVYGETNETLTRWKGSLITESDYWTEPWEIEAYGRECGLFTKFAVKEKLWNVFNNIVNPDDPIESEELGWKYPEEDVVNLQQNGTSEAETLDKMPI